MIDRDALNAIVKTGRPTDAVVVTRRYLAQVQRELMEAESRPSSLVPAADYDPWARRTISTDLSIPTGMTDLPQSASA